MKYKCLNVAGVEHPDLYQLLAYVTAPDLPGGLLVYAAGEGDAVTHQVVHIGRTLEVTTLDLRGSPSMILAQVQQLACQVERLRRRALTRTTAV